MQPIQLQLVIVQRSERMRAVNASHDRADERGVRPWEGFMRKLSASGTVLMVLLLVTDCVGDVSVPSPSADASSPDTSSGSDGGTGGDSGCSTASGTTACDTVMQAFCQALVVCCNASPGCTTNCPNGANGPICSVSACRQTEMTAVDCTSSTYAKPICADLSGKCVTDLNSESCSKLGSTSPFNTPACLAFFNSF